MIRAPRRWFQTRAVLQPARPNANAVRILAESTTHWEGPGPVALTDRHLIFDADGERRQTSLHTVAKVEWAGDAIWIRRRRAHDWLLSLADASDAERVWRTIAEALGAAEE